MADPVGGLSLPHDKGPASSWCLVRVGCWDLGGSREGTARHKAGIWIVSGRRQKCPSQDSGPRKHKRNPEQPWQNRPSSSCREGTSACVWCTSRDLDKRALCRQGGNSTTPQFIVISGVRTNQRLLTECSNWPRREALIFYLCGRRWKGVAAFILRGKRKPKDGRQSALAGHLQKWRGK